MLIQGLKMIRKKICMVVYSSIRGVATSSELGGRGRFKLGPFCIVCIVETKVV